MTVTRFRILVILTFSFMLFSYALAFYHNKELVSFVADFSESLLEVGEIRSNLYHLSFFAMLFIAIYSFVGLIFLRKNARFAFLVAFSLLIPSYLLLGVSVQSGLSRIFYDIGILMSGVLLTLIFTDPMKDYFAD